MARILQGHPGLLLTALPAAVVVAAIKLGLIGLSWQPLDFSPLLTGVIAAEIFIVGFLLTGTVADYKEAEHLPGEIAAGLETMADECLITHADIGIPQARGCLAQLVRIAGAIRLWLENDASVETVLDDLRALNPFFIVFAPRIQAGFTSRLKTEQAGIRLRVLRIDTMRRTSFVSAVYLVGEVVGLVLVVVLLLTDVGSGAPTVTMVGVVSFLLFYLFALIRELDNPFEYPHGTKGATDVSLDVLARTEDRLATIARTLTNANAGSVEGGQPHPAGDATGDPELASDPAVDAAVAVDVAVDTSAGVDAASA